MQPGRASQTAVQVCMGRAMAHGRSEEVFAAPPHVIDEIEAEHGADLRRLLEEHGREADGFYLPGTPSDRRWRKLPSVNPFT